MTAVRDSQTEPDRPLMPNRRLIVTQMLASAACVGLTTTVLQEGGFNWLFMSALIVAAATFGFWFALMAEASGRSDPGRGRNPDLSPSARQPEPERSDQRKVDESGHGGEERESPGVVRVEAPPSMLGRDPCRKEGEGEPPSDGQHT